MAARGGGAQRSNVIPREKLLQFKLVLVGEGKGERGRREEEDRGREGAREGERYKSGSLKQERLQNLSCSG